MNSKTLKHVIAIRIWTPKDVWLIRLIQHAHDSVWYSSRKINEDFRCYKLTVGLEFMQLWRKIEETEGKGFDVQLKTLRQEMDKLLRKLLAYRGKKLCRETLDMLVEGSGESVLRFLGADGVDGEVTQSETPEEEGMKENPEDNYNHNCEDTQSEPEPLGEESSGEESGRCTVSDSELDYRCLRGAPARHGRGGRI